MNRYIRVIIAIFVFTLCSVGIAGASVDQEGFVNIYDNNSNLFINNTDEYIQLAGNYKKRKAGQSAKEAAKDIPSWAAGKKPFVGESGSKFAERVMKEKYPGGNYPTGPGSEYSKLKKYGDRAFK